MASILISLLIVTNIFGAIAQNAGEPSSSETPGLPLSNIKVINSVTDEEGAIMWYGWESRLVCIQLNRDGLSADFTESPLIQENGDPMPTTAFISLTMLEDGSLLFATEVGSTKPFVSKLFHIEDPQCDGNTSNAKFLGIMPDDIGIEALYTDALNRVYVMDTGQQHSSSVDNRLLRFTGDVVMGDFTYEVVKGPPHLVPDIDGLGPGINKTNGWVVDTPGFAIDSYNLYNIDYETGAFSFIGTTDGPYATHAINGSYFSDGKSRLYTLTGIPQVGETSSTLYEIDPDTGVTLRNLGSGPSGMGLTGSLAPGPGDFPDENEPPVADAGLDQTVNEGDVVILDGSNSTGGTTGDVIPPSNLVSWWPGDGNASDITDGNHGTLIGGTTYDTGKVDQAFSFDGVNDRVSVGDSENLKITDSLTIDVWLYVKSYADPSKGHAQIIFRGDDRSGLDPYYLSIEIGGTIRFHVESLSNKVNLETPIPKNQFVFVAATLDDATGLMRIYIDGALAAETTTSIRPFKDLNPSYNPGIAIGNHAPSTIHNQPFHGLIDELEIFYRALTPSEIQSIFNAGAAGKNKGTSFETKIVSYEWDFESDGIYDYQETESNSPDGTFDGIINHVYGDDGIFKATLRITNNQNLTDTDTCNITVLNVDPKVTIQSAVMDVEIGLRVAGRKYNNVSMALYEEGNLIGQVSIERLPGSPNDQMAWIPVTLDMTKTYNATVIYTPEDPPNIGGNPVWIYIKFKNGSIKKVHHTFNVQQSKKRDSDHWNHVEPWEVDINTHLKGQSFEIISHITDPGSDDETLTFTYGSQVVTITYLNDPPNPDPFPSPEVKPMDIIDTTTLTYEGPGTISLVVEDDDNIRLGIGQGTDSFDVV